MILYEIFHQLWKILRPLKVVLYIHIFPQVCVCVCAQASWAAYTCRPHVIQLHQMLYRSLQIEAGQKINQWIFQRIFTHNYIKEIVQV